uniref:Uncharacterized protein LOC102806686 n=1 Tax=Saccoglossus kowalevskii TaxID=10224 RepID=A0ABM0MRG9_SACKO|nr:PREDICTED: uncharacterized protein LOC102806686 [Saccoglossus kowalevskii]
MFVGALLIVDGDILSTSPTKFWESDNFIDVPLMIGSMAQEIDIYPTVGDQIKDWTWHDYEIYVRSKFDSFDDTMSDRILELYPPSQRYSTPELSFTTMASDIRVTCGNDEITDIASRKFQSPVYRFVGTARPSKPVHWFGFGAEYAFHGWDMMGFFDSMNQYIEPNSDDRLFRDRMQVYLTSFAQTGNPDDNWLKWTGLGSTALLSHDIKYTHRFNKTRCDFMKDNGFLSYSWIN